MTLRHNEMMDDFIDNQKVVRAALQASLDQLQAGHASYEGQIGGGIVDITARQIGLLQSAIKEADLLIADYEAPNA